MIEEKIASWNRLIDLLAELGATDEHIRTFRLWLSGAADDDIVPEVGWTFTLLDANGDVVKFPATLTAKSTFNKPE